MNSIYLMLVTFLVHGFSSLTPAMVSEFQESPYNSIAVPIGDAYDTGPVPALASFDSDVARLKGGTSKDIWPWVFTNYLIGTNPANMHVHPRSERILDIRGWDLDNQAGARARFLEWWRLSFQLAKELGSPGVVADLETYNDYDSQKIPVLANDIGRTPDEVVRSLKALGATMADIAGEELPGAKIFFFFTRLHNPRVAVAWGKSYYASETYLVIGMLERIKQKGMRVTLISGGEEELWYCSASLQDLRRNIQGFRNGESSFLAQYPGNLVEAGTMTLWADASLKQDWLARSSCGQNPARNVEELEPYLQELFRSYEYVWIYAGSPKWTGYQPFDPTIAPRFNKVMKDALKVTGHSTD